MADIPEKDHWRELADLLGLPPDENNPAPAAPPPAIQKQEKDVEPATLKPTLPEAEPVAEDSFEAPGFEEIVVTEAPFQVESVIEPAPVTPSEPETREREVAAAEESPHERPRSGRRRGRRGSRDDVLERDNRQPPQSAPRMERETAPVVESFAEERAEAEPTEEGRAERGRGRRRPQPESRRRDYKQSDVEEEEILENEDAEQPETPAAEEDDEEIDKLTDWNVPSWTELIGSLYRPER